MARTKAGERLLSEICNQGCVVCRLFYNEFSPAEVHHIRDGNVGVGQRASDEDVLPLCPAHHRTGNYGVAFHAGRGKWEEKFGTQRELLEKVRELL